MIHHCQVPESERKNIEFVCPICKDKYKQNRILPHLQYCEFQADEIAKGCPHCEKTFKTEYKTKSDITNNYRQSPFKISPAVGSSYEIECDVWTLGRV